MDYTDAFFYDVLRITQRLSKQPQLTAHHRQMLGEIANYGCTALELPTRIQGSNVFDFIGDQLAEVMNSTKPRTFTEAENKAVASNIYCTTRQEADAVVKTAERKLAAEAKDLPKQRREAEEARLASRIEHLKTLADEPAMKRNAILAEVKALEAEKKGLGAA